MKRGRIVIEVILLILLVVFVLITSLKFQPHIIPVPFEPPLASFCPQQTAFVDTKSGIGVENVRISPSSDVEEGVGLSEGRFAFNIAESNGVKKCQASQALSRGHIKDAENLWAEALHIEPNDAEVLIYQEDQRILDQKLPYIDIIVGAIASGTVISNGRDILQGTYAAQRRYNQDHTQAFQIRVIIANFGSTGANAGQVAHQIITAAQKDDHLRAMVDLPVLANTSTVINILSSGGFPIVLSNGSSSNQEIGNNFFHVAATTTEQGQKAATYVEENCPNLLDDIRLFDCTGLHIVAFIDGSGTDNYSSSLGEAFVNKLNDYRGSNMTNKDVHTIFYSSTDPETITQDIKAFGNSLPDLIYFAGNAVNANILLQNLPPTAKTSNLRILGGDALYQTGTGYNADDYSHLSFTSFAYPDEWSILKRPSPIPNFLCDYAQDFAGGIVSSPKCSGWQTNTSGRYGYGYSRPENDVILSYDALGVIANRLAAAGDIPSQDQLLQSIRTINDANPFEGVSGRIAFGTNGNPIDKAILVLRVNEKANTRQEKQYGTLL